MPDSVQSHPVTAMVITAVVRTRLPFTRRRQPHNVTQGLKPGKRRPQLPTTTDLGVLEPSPSLATRWGYTIDNLALRTLGLADAVCRGAVMKCSIRDNARPRLLPQ